MDDQAKIVIRDLELYYGRSRALKGVNLEIPDRRVTALIGPSGCGKSSFLRCLNRMNDLIPGVRIRGTVLLDGEDVYHPDTDVVWLRKRVGMVFQRPNPFPMTIFENVAYGPRIHGARGGKSLQKLVESSLRAASLWDEVKGRLDRPALGLSGGQQQRLCLARLLAVRPEVLLMDEPTSALDPASTAKIEELIRGLREEYTFVIVTHSLAQAARVSDFTAFFLSGELLESGPTSKVFAEARDPRTRDYVSGRFG